MAIVKQRAHKRKGLARLIAALGHQSAGLSHALAHDPAVREVAIGTLVLIAISTLLPVSKVEHLLLVICTAQVLLMEVVNSAIEATVDRISEEQHPLAKEAKDLGSVAVGLSVLLASVCWFVTTGPLALHWLGLARS